MISLLYIDDEPGLLELGKLFLESAGGFEVSTALSGDEGLGQLAQHDFDAIVSDFQMPGMDGIELLKKVRKSFGTIPFILFTGRGREEVVIEAINNGVDFYLQKGGDPKAQFAELAHKIRQAVSRRKAETALSDSEKQLADIINFLPDATFAIDTKGMVIAWNRAMERMTGVKSEDVLGKGDYEYALPFYHVRRPLLINLVLDNDPAIAEKYPFVKKDGRTLFSEITIPHFNDGRGAALWFTASPLYDRKGEVVGAIESIREITERKRAEEKLVSANREYTNLLDQIQDVYYRSDSQGRLVRASRSWATLLGYSDVSECIGRNIAADFYFHPPDRERLLAVIAKNGKVTGYEVTLKKKDGTPVIVEVSSHPYFDPAGTVIGIEGMFRDITGRKRAEEERNESERRFRELAELLPQGIYEADIHGRMTYVNRLGLEMFGYTDDEIKKGVTVTGAIAPEDRNRAATSFRRMITEGISPAGSSEYLAMRKDGSTFPIAIYSSPILREGRVIGSRGIIMDITERKKTEDEIRAANEQLVASDEELRAQYDELALGEKRVRMSETRLRYMLGFDEYTKKSERELLEYAIEGAGVVTDSPLGYLAFLNEDESELSMYAWSKNAMAECSMRTKPIVYKTEKTGLWGEAVRQRQAVITNDYAAPDPAKKGYPEGHPRIIRHMNVPVIEDGHVILVAGVANKTSGYTEKDVNELLLLMQGLWNILKRRHAEETRNQSEAKYRNIINHAPSGMHFYELKPDGSLVFTGSNPGADRILGIVHRQFIGKTIEEAFPPLVETEIPAQYRRVARNGGVWQTEQVTYDGEAVHGAYAVTAFQTSPGAMVAMFVDITKRKRAEEALFSSQQMLQAVLDSIPQRVFWKDRNSVFLGCNKPLALDAGYTDPADLVGKTDYDHASHATADLYRADDRQVMETGQPRINFEEPQVRPDGNHAWLRTTKVPLRNKEGAIIGVLGTYEDITDRRRTEQALRESEEKYRTLVESAFDGIAIHQDGILVYVNKTAARLLGSENPDEFIGRPAVDIVSPELRQRIAGRIQQSPEKALEILHEKFLRLDGTAIDVDVTSTPGTWKGKPAAFVTFRDISERTRAEGALRESEEKYRTLVETNRDIIYSLSTDGTILYVSPQVIARLGYLPGEMVGQNFTDFIHPEDIGILKNHIRKNSVAGSRIDSDRFRVRRKDGVYRWFEDTTIYTTDRQKRSIVTGTIRDITGEKAAYDALGESEGRYRSLVELSPDAVVVHQGGKVLYANPAALRLMGAKNEEEIIGREVISFIHPDDQAMALEDFRQLYEEGKIIPQKEERLVRINGDPFTVEVIASPIQYQGNRSVLVVFRDITERKRAEDALRENIRKYAELFELGGEAIFLIDNETGALLEANAAACEMYGYPRDLLLTMKNTDLSAEREETKKVTTESPPGLVRVPVRYHRRKDGSVFPVEIIGRFFTWNGRPVHIAAIRDITVQNQSEAAILEANRKLNLLNSITRHDIRNQLTVALGYTQLAALSKPDPVVVDFLARITAAIETIQRQIEFTKTYQELGVHAPAWFRLADVISIVRPDKTALRNTCKAIEIFADPMIDRVFFNLFDNAMKYGEKVTTVTVGCGRRGDNLVITFADNGIGIAPGEKQKIFEKGYGKNTGLGLFLVREILAITDITISETGTPGEGAVFEIVVPSGAYRNAE